MTNPATVLDGRYHLLEVLGEGGMGSVYSALDLTSGEHVAVKTLKKELADNAGLKERFEREARALFALQHPHVVRVLDFGIADGTAYIVQEMLVGRTLANAIEAEPLDPILALGWAREIVSALAFAHAQGVVHRDLKATNVFLRFMPGVGESTKLIDFGLVRFVDTAQWGAGASLTTDGEIMGSPGYISPEQTFGQRADATSDVYSAGVLLYELLTGRWPFEEEDRLSMFRAHLLKPPPHPSSVRLDLKLSPALDAVLQKALAKKRDDRFVDAVALLSALDTVPTPGAWVE